MNWKKLQKIAVITLGAIAIHFIKNLVTDGQTSDTLTTCVLVALASSVDTNK